MAKFIIISLLLFSVFNHAEAAMITVTTPSDVVNSSDGVTSLREAISEANSLEGMDTITFSPDLNGKVINLINDVLRITDHLTINGPGRNNLTINNGDSYEGRIFYVSDNDNEKVITVVFNDFRISNGITNNITHGGAGIFNWENMEVNRCAIVGCKQQIARGGAIHNIGQNAVMVINNSLIDNNLSAVGGAGIFNDGGTLTLNSCIVSDNHSAALEGGGIFNFNGTCIINSCQIEGNKVLTNGAGGGIYNYNGTCKIFNSNIVSNEVNDRGTVSKVSCGGGLYNNKDGLMIIVNSAIYRNKAIAYNTGENIYAGGIVNFGEMSISNSTVSENSASAVEKSASYCGGIHNIGNLYIWNCTIVNNTAGTAAGGFILEQGMLQMANSIVANNNSVFYNDFYATSTNNKFLGKNIIEDGSFTGTGILNVDPQLGPLDNNGGSTLTHALLKGSPAIDAGDNNFIGLDDFDIDGDGIFDEKLPFDQRGPGFLRVYNNTVDLGALEYVGSSQGNGQIAVNPDMLHFDTVITEQPYILSIFVKNKGTSDLKVTGWKFSSGTSKDFSFVTKPTTTIIAPNDSFKIEIKYLTHDAGIDTGILVIMSDDPDNPIFNVPIKGIGKTLAPQILVQPGSIDFKDVFLGQTVTMEVRIANTGSSDLIISDISISSGSSSAFSAAVDHSAIIVKPGDTINFNAIYNPQKVGTDTGTITISSNDPDLPSFNIPLSGNGAPAPVAEIEVNPMDIDFKTVYIGQTESRHITIRNIGTEVLTVSEIAFAETSNLDISITSGFSGASIPAGDSIQIEVLCTPKDSGVMTASLIIRSNDEHDSVLTVNISAHAKELPMPIIEVSPLVLDFDTMNAGQSKTMEICIRNTGNIQLNVTSVSFGSGTSSAFTINDGPTSKTVDPDDSIYISVTYHAGIPGDDKGTLEIHSDDPNSPLFEIPLQGTSLELPVPVLISPVKAAINLSLPVTVKWNSIDVAETFHLQVSQYSDLSSTFIDISDITDTLFTLEDLETGNTYYWRVRAANKRGPGDWSEIRNFTTRIDKIVLSITGIIAEDKVYDGTTAVTLSGGTLTGIIDGDDVTLNVGSGFFEDKNVGTSKNVIVSGYSLSGADASKYSLIQPPSITADITPKPVFLTGITAADKVYDGNTIATLSNGTLNGVIYGDDVKLNIGSGVFSDKNVGTGITVIVSGYSLSGADASNYSFIQPTGISADITPKPVLLTGITAADKVYDGNTIATLSNGTLNDVIDGDDVKLNYGSGVFSDKNVGTGITVIVSGYSLSGADASNYSLILPTGLTANITAATLTIKAEDKEKEQGKEDPVFTVSYSGLVTDDDSSVVTGLIIEREPGEISGTYAIIPSGATAPNYKIKYENGILTIQASTSVLVYNRNNDITSKSLYPDKGIFIGPNPASLESGKAHFRIITNRPADIKIFIYDAVGNMIFDTKKSTSDGKLDMSWNFLTTRKKHVGSGTFLVVAKIEYRNGSKEVMKAKLGVKR
jgi:hypothetical protein